MASTKRDSGGLGPFMTAHEVARYLRVHPATLYRLLRQGRVPAFKIGTDWRFIKNEVDQWMRRSEIRSEARQDSLKE